ncbi:MAG: ribonuclease III domain-containing protein [Verrucomicrobiota bacterium]
MQTEEEKRQLQTEAWIGDSVLGLFVRRLIVAEDGDLNGEKYARYTSNKWLSHLGDPTEVEAEIGRVFEAKGLDAGFEHIRTKILPILIREEKSHQNSVKQRAEAKKKTTKRSKI